MRKYAWKPDLPDHRDFIYTTAVSSLAGLPQKVDLRSKCSPVKDQDALGSCTAHAISAAIEFDDIRDGAPIDVSRLFIYYQERKIEGTVNHDAGAMIRDGVKACASLGAPLESLWPYDVAKFKLAPSAASKKDAAKRKISTYKRVTSLKDVLSALASGLPVVFGFSVYESFESDEVAKTGVVTMPGANERLLGGHAVLAVGYDLDAGIVIVKNSWGTSWGQNGYFTMPIDYIRSASLSDDFWVIQK